jgi:FMN-dependent NADH-azoreductase
VSNAQLGADLTKGGAYMQELVDADIVVIGAPMYNFSVPSQLKAWIDRVVVAGKTFRYGANGPEGSVSSAKKVFIASSRGNVYASGSPNAPFEHHESYLTSVLMFIGLADIAVIRAKGPGLSPAAREAAMAKAREQIAAIAA